MIFEKLDNPQSRKTFVLAMVIIGGGMVLLGLWIKFYWAERVIALLEKLK